MTRRSNEELARDHPRALVDQLIERVLTVGAGLTPNNRTAFKRQVSAIHADTFAVTLHLELLEVGRQTRKVVVIGQHSTGCETANLIVPNPNQSQQCRQVFFPLCSAEVGVHRLTTAQERTERIRANGDHQRQANRPPHGITTTDPILEPKHARRRNAKGRRLIHRRRKSRELRRRVGNLFAHPRLCGASVGHCFNRGKGLGRDDHQCRRGIAGP